MDKEIHKKDDQSSLKCDKVDLHISIVSHGNIQREHLIALILNKLLSPKDT